MSDFPRMIVAAVAASTVLSACGSDEPEKSAEPAAGPNGEKIYQLGEVADVERFGSVTVENPEAANDDFSSFITVDTTLVNEFADEAMFKPTFGIVCGGEQVLGGLHTDNTVWNGEFVDAGGTVEGKAVLLLPGDERMLEPVKACATPAYVAVTADDELGSDRTALIRLPDAVVKKANDLRVDHHQG